MFKNTLIYTIGNILPKMIVFLMLPVYMNYLSPEEYGLIQTINALIMILSIFYLTSLRTSVTRSYIDHESDSEKKGFILSIFIFIVAFAIILSIFLISLKDIISPYLFNNIPTDPYYFYLILLSFLTIFPIIPLAILRIKEEPIKFVLFNALETILIVVLTIYLLIIKDMGAVGSLQALIYARLIMAVIYIIYVINFTKLKLFEFKVIYITSSLALALPLIPHFLAGWVNSASDRVLIEQFLNLHSLGIYSLGAQFNMGIMLLINSFNMAYAPRFFKMMKRSEITQRFFSRIFEVTIYVFSLASLVILILIPLFVEILGNETYESRYLFTWLLFGGSIWHLGYILSVSSLVYYKKMKNVAMITVSIAVVNVILNIFLIPIIGIFGASLATYIAYFFEFYFVKRLANHYNENVFQINSKTLYMAQFILIVNLISVWLLESYYIVGGTIIIIVIIIIRKEKQHLIKSLSKLTKKIVSERK